MRSGAAATSCRAASRSRHARRGRERARRFPSPGCSRRNKAERAARAEQGKCPGNHRSAGTDRHGRGHAHGIGPAGCPPARGIPAGRFRRRHLQVGGFPAARLYKSRRTNGTPFPYIRKPVADGNFRRGIPRRRPRRIRPAALPLPRRGHGIKFFTLPP